MNILWNESIQPQPAGGAAGTAVPNKAYAKYGAPKYGQHILIWQLPNMATSKYGSSHARKARL